jgi:hypothetical protein
MRCFEVAEQEVDLRKTPSDHKSGSIEIVLSQDLDHRARAPKRHSQSQDEMYNRGRARKGTWQVMQVD